ncbi:GNAT family N-acetyltransferase [Pseudomonas pseudonitroreducens]|uniref:GNAT family N-acetyltransferase n=1 Tax=Pseudomonas pseudonitroreducens TaxID=2892326 RepID=UPI001F3C1C5C|nr:GNAT family N-acetyltransferase [Pseudomonas pseudonitroreducens]
MDGIRIERCTEQHINGLAALYNEPAVARQLLQMPHQAPELWRKRLVLDDERRLTLLAMHQDQVVGSASLEQYPRVRRAHCGSIGMGVATAWQGRGVGTRLLAELMEVADNWMGLRRVELTVFSDNQPAIALYQKFGFEVEGQLREYAIRDGVYTDVLSMARLRRS